MTSISILSDTGIYFIIIFLIYKYFLTPLSAAQPKPEGMYACMCACVWLYVCVGRGRGQCSSSGVKKSSEEGTTQAVRTKLDFMMHIIFASSFNGSAQRRTSRLRHSFLTGGMAKTRLSGSGAKERAGPFGCVCVCKKRAAQAEDGGRTPKASEEWPHITYTFLKACARALTQVSRWQKDFLLSIRRNCFPILVLSRSLVPPGFLRSAFFFGLFYSFLLASFLAIVPMPWPVAVAACACSEYTAGTPIPGSPFWCW